MQSEQQIFEEKYRQPIPVSDYFLKKANSIVRALIVSDVLWISGMGLLGPIFALYVVDFINGGNAEIAGIAATVYLATKSVMQIPAATIIDRIRGEVDDYTILLAATAVGAFLPMLYLFIETPIQLYAVQFCLGLAMAFAFPPFMAIFTRHIDKGREGYEWGVYFTLVDMGSAIAAGVGGFLAANYGFQSVVVGVSTLGLLGIFVIIPIRKYMRRAHIK
ncbi:MAG: MFS transporter [Patescibacteria group bacterium]